MTGKWIKARYVAERLEARYTEWEIIGEPKYRRPDRWIVDAVAVKRPSLAAR